MSIFNFAEGKRRALSICAVLLFTALFSFVSLNQARAEITASDLGFAERDNTENSEVQEDSGEVLAAVVYSPLSLTSSNNQALKFEMTALEIQNGTWIYKATWNRTLDRQGSVYVSPKTNRSATLNMNQSGATISKTGERVMDLAPATRYRVEFYSQPNGQGTLLLRKYFNTLDQNGNTVATSNIPPSRGGTQGVTVTTTTGNQNLQTTTLATGTGTPLPGDANVPIGQGGSNTSCTVPAPYVVGNNSLDKPIVSISKEMWEKCLGGRGKQINVAGTIDWTFVTFANGLTLPSSLFVGIFNNNTPEVAYRKAYKIIHSLPFPNNPAVTSPDDPEAAINLPYFITQPADHPSKPAIVKLMAGDIFAHTESRQDVPTLWDLGGSFSNDVPGYDNRNRTPFAPGIMTLYPNLSYKVRWQVSDRPYSLPAAHNFGTNFYDNQPPAPETVDIYLFQGDNNCGNLYKPGYAVDMERWQKCREKFAQFQAFDQENNVITNFGKGYVLVAKNVPYKNGQAQFFMPDPPNITFPGKITDRPYVGGGKFNILVMDSKVTPFEAQNEGKGEFLARDYSGSDPYAKLPVLTPQQRAWKTPVAALAVNIGLDTGRKMLFTSIPNLTPTAPMPWYVMHPTVNQEAIDAEYLRNGQQNSFHDWDSYREVTIEGGVGRPFWEKIQYYYEQEKKFGSVPGDFEITKPVVTFSGSLPSGLKRVHDQAYASNDVTSYGEYITVGALIGTPNSPGEYVYNVKATQQKGNRTIVGLTKYIIRIRPTESTQMTVTKISGSAGGQFQAGDTVKIVTLNDNGKNGPGQTAPFTFYIAPAGGGCNTQDPKSYKQCNGSVGIHPDFVKKVAISNKLEVEACNNALSGGSDPLVAWGCSEYQWRVGNVPGSNLSPGNYVIYATQADIQNEYDVVGDFWAAAQITIAPGGVAQENYSQYQSIVGLPVGEYPIRFDCAVNGRDVNCTDAPSGFMGAAQGLEPQNNAYVKTGSFNANPGDTVTIGYSAKPRNAGSGTLAPNLVWGNDWESKIGMYYTRSNNNNTDEQNKQCSSFLVPGGFSFGDSVDFTGVMNGPEGTISFVVPECMRGGAFIINYSAILGCSRLDLDCAFTKHTLRMGVGIGGAGVPGGGDEVVSGTCRLPSQFNSISCIDPRASGSGATASASYRIKWNVANINPLTGGLNTVGSANNTVAEPGFGYNLYAISSPDASDLESGNLCQGNNSCNYNKLQDISGNRETLDRVFTPLNQTNYVKLYAYCPGQTYVTGPKYESEIATCAVTKDASNQPVISQTAVVGNPTCTIREDMFNDLSSYTPIDGKSFSPHWAGAAGEYDRLVFRAGTNLEAVMRGCTADDMSSGKCIYKTGDPGTQHPNGIQNSSTITVSGTTPDTTYWARIVAVCDYGKPTQRQVDAVWQITTGGSCYGVLNNSQGGNCPLD